MNPTDILSGILKLVLFYINHYSHPVKRKDFQATLGLPKKLESLYSGYSFLKTRQTLKLAKRQGGFMKIHFRNQSKALKKGAIFSLTTPMYGNF